MIAKRLRFTVEITTTQPDDTYKHLSWVLEDGISKMRTDLVNHHFYLGNVKVLRKAVARKSRWSKP